MTKFREYLTENFSDSKGKEIKVGDYVIFSKLKPKQESKVVDVSDKGIKIIAVTGKGVGSRDKFFIPKIDMGYVTKV